VNSRRVYGWRWDFIRTNTAYRGGNAVIRIDAFSGAVKFAFFAQR
jgi:hypothetical protein